MNRLDHGYRIPMARPSLRGNELPYVQAALRDAQLTMGFWVQRFEEDFATYLGVKHAVAVSSGTAALHLALLAAGVKPGDRVLVPTLTYVASVAAIRYCGAIPVFGEADPGTWGLPLGIPERPERIDWTLPVHLYGVPSLTAMSLPYVIEDAAEALGASIKDKAAGTYGRVATFSFYGNKILTTGEGGMVVTDDASLAEEVRLLRGQGQDPHRRYWHTRVGFNYRMTDLQAALGLGQLEQLNAMLQKRRVLHERYIENLVDTRLSWQSPRPGTTRAPWVFACLLPRAKHMDGVNVPQSFPNQRDWGMTELARHGIETRPTFPCVHQMPPYREFARQPGGAYTEADFRGTTPLHFPVAEDIAARGLLLPLHAEMTLAQVDEVCGRLLELL